MCTFLQFYNVYMRCGFIYRFYVIEKPHKTNFPPILLVYLLIWVLNWNCLLYAQLRCGAVLNVQRMYGYTVLSVNRWIVELFEIVSVYQNRIPENKTTRNYYFKKNKINCSTRSLRTNFQLNTIYTIRVFLFLFVVVLKISG